VAIIRIPFEPGTKHPGLVSLAKGYGGQSRLARKLQSHPTLVGRWFNLLDYPSDSEAFDRKILLVSSLTFADLWPPQLRIAIDKNKLWPGYRHRHRQMLGGYLADVEARNVIPAPDEIASSHELQEAVRQAVNTLDARTRTIVQLRFGLGTGVPLKLAEIGDVFKRDKERIRQIEARGLRSLQSVLSDFIPADTRDRAWWVWIRTIHKRQLAEASRRSALSLKQLIAEREKLKD
jgi:RNA polymerase sigma factor (sigma-70 family)